VISGLCEATVVVEAPERSGALITASHALEAGRDVWAVPGPLGVPECRGSNKLIADGAEVLWDVEEFLEAVGSKATDPAESEPAAAVPTELPTRIWKSCPPSAISRPPDQLSKRLAKPNVVVLAYPETIGVHAPISEKKR